MSMITRGERRISIHQVVLDQADFFQNDGFTRRVGLTVADLTSQLFYNNVLLPWPLIDGVSVSDGHLKAGSLYFHEIVGTPGNYSLRLRPNTTGYWRVLVVYAAGQQILSRDYDISAEPLPSGGLTASFTNC